MRFILFVLCAGLTCSAARAAHTEAQLQLAAGTARPGDTVLAGVQLKMESGWHTYWKNPGAAGQATEIQWHLPPGVTAGEIQWPLPKKIPPADVVTFGYEDEVVLLVPLQLDKNLPAGPLNLAAKISWLECKEQCIPASAEVQAVLTVGGETIPAAGAATLPSWQARVPVTGAPLDPHAFWQNPPAENPRTLLLEVDWPAPGAKTMHQTVDFFPAASDDFELQPETQKLLDATGELEFTKAVKKFSGDWPKSVAGVLVLDNAAYELTFPISDFIAPPAAATAPAIVPAVPPAPPALWQMLIYAFIGGLILNIMPCVLPVIALKILGFVSEAKSSPRHVRRLGLIYAGGVLLSFLALAALVIGVKAAGHQAGWGMQFGSPVFIVLLTLLVTLVALNLFGVFEVTLGGGALNVAGDLAARHGAAGAFFNGVLATLLATPCTAPFLSIALGFAFAQNAAIIVAVFLTVGLGLAAPYVLLSWQPAWLKFLPKPGAWMEKFKIAMGFPMLATVVWLFNLAAGSYGGKVLWLGIFLVIAAFAAWVFGEFVQRGRRKTAAGIVVVLLLGGGYFFTLEKALDWRTPPAENAAGSLKESPEGIDWQPWSPAAVAAARAAGKVVLVDFTADWCLTCQVNKKTSLEIAAVREKLKLLGAVALLGDYTHSPAAITTELNRFHRAGVPLVLVYPKDAAAEPLVLPEVLTPGIVLDALATAAK